MYVSTCGISCLQLQRVFHVSCIYCKNCICLSWMSTVYKLFNGGMVTNFVSCCIAVLWIYGLSVTIFGLSGLWPLWGSRVSSLAWGSLVLSPSWGSLVLSPSLGLSDVVIIMGLSGVVTIYGALGGCHHIWGSRGLSPSMGLSGAVTIYGFSGDVTIYGLPVLSSLLGSRGCHNHGALWGCRHIWALGVVIIMGLSGAVAIYGRSGLS